MYQLAQQRPWRSRNWATEYIPIHHVKPTEQNPKQNHPLDRESKNTAVFEPAGGGKRSGVTVKHHAFGTWAAPPLVEARNKTNFWHFFCIICIFLCLSVCLHSIYLTWNIKESSWNQLWCLRLRITALFGSCHHTRRFFKGDWRCPYSRHKSQHGKALSLGYPLLLGWNTVFNCPSLIVSDMFAYFCDFRPLYVNSRALGRDQPSFALLTWAHVAPRAFRPNLNYLVLISESSLHRSVSWISGCCCRHSRSVDSTVKKCWTERCSGFRARFSLLKIFCPLSFSQLSLPKICPGITKEFIV